MKLIKWLTYGISWLIMEYENIVWQSKQQYVSVDKINKWNR